MATTVTDKKINVIDSKHVLWNQILAAAINGDTTETTVDEERELILSLDLPFVRDSVIAIAVSQDADEVIFDMNQIQEILEAATTAEPCFERVEAIAQWLEMLDDRVEGNANLYATIAYLYWWVELPHRSMHYAMSAVGLDPNHSLARLVAQGMSVGLPAPWKYNC
ncbi:MAG: hypothetical protein WBH73_08625 [Arcanobacterium sp.]